jgi:hypothetical protein
MYIDPQPDYVFSIWLRGGLTSKGLFTAGLALDFVPFTVGIDVAPRNELGRFRVFAGLKDGEVFTPVSCNFVVAASGALVYAFGPGQSGQFGVQVGVHLEDRPITNVNAGGPISFPQREFGGSFRFSVFPKAGTLQDFDLGVGLVWAPHGACQSD